MEDNENELEALQARLGRLQYRERLPAKFADILSSLMAKRGYSQVMASCELAEAWNAAAGNRFARHCRVGHLVRGTLEVTVRNSVALQELMFRKAEILQRLSELLPAVAIRNLRFRVGRVD